jgi:glutaredoxin-dependent peroxiredoxin
MSIEVGAAAPDFTLPDQDREPVSLSRRLQQGPVLLAFFPGAFSGTCTSEACTLQDALSEFTTAGVQVLGISTDTFFALKAWGDSQKITFPLLSDFNKEVVPQYGVLNPDMIGLKNIAKRAVFLIDRTGTVRYREVIEDARHEPDYARLREAIATLS